MAEGVEGFVYVIRLSRPLGSDHPRGRAAHYVGWSLSPYDRLEEHRKGQGAKMLRAANQQAIPYDIVLILPGTRALEHEIKSYKGTDRWLKRHAGSGEYHAPE